MKTFRAVILNPIAPAKTTGALWFKPDDRGVITIYHWVGGSWIPLYVNVDITQEDYNRMRDAVIEALESEYDTAEEIAEKYVSKAGDTIIGTIFFKNTIEVDKPADFKSIINALGGINANGQHISNLASPIHDTDAATKEYVDRRLATKQNTLISGTNIKTINNESILGSGNIDIKDIFIATYNVTPFDAVYAAFNSGKVVLCKYGTQVYLATNDEGGEIWFESMRSGAYVTISKVWVDYNNVWRFESARHIMTSTETESEISVAMSTKQDTLISGTNIKTINNTSLLGNGNIAIDSDMAASSDKSSYIKNKVGGYKIYVPNDDITLNFGGRWLDGDSPITKTFDQLFELGCPQSVIDTIKAKKVSVGFYGEGIFLGEAYYDWEEYPEGICFLPTEGEEVEFTYIDIHNTADGEDEGGSYSIIPLPSRYVPSKQDKLVSGTNIKTINNQSLLGGGNIEIQGGGTDNLFIAEYAVTRVSDIIDAYNDEKTIVAKKTNNAGGYDFYQLLGYNDSAIQFDFYAIDDSTIKRIYIVDQGGETAEEEWGTGTTTDLNSSDIFWATYNLTTLAQVQSAINSGKLVFVKVDGIALHCPGITSDVAVFTSFVLGYGYISVSLNSNGWEQAVLTNPEYQNNKVTSIGAASSDIQYPSAKAVYDALITKQDVLVSNEDITIYSNNLLKFANRSVAANQKGYVILRKNKTFAEQVTQENTIYEIRYPFTLSANFTIPSGCILRFNGGSISGAYTLTGNDTMIEAVSDGIFNGVTIGGTWKNPAIYSSWFSKDAETIRQVFALNNPDIHTKVVIDGDYDVNISDSIGIDGNTDVYLSGTLKKTSNSVPNFTMFQITGSNVRFFGGVINGNKSAFDTTSEYGHGIGVSGGAKNVLVSGVIVKDCRGDGIYVGSTDSFVENLCISWCKINGARRNGISLIYAKNVEISDCIFYDINATAPGLAIDIEPNNSGQKNEHISILRCEIDTCKNGISLTGTNEVIRDVLVKNCKFNLDSYNYAMFWTGGKVVQLTIDSCEFNLKNHTSSYDFQIGAGTSEVEKPRIVNCKIVSETANGYVFGNGRADIVNCTITSASSIFQYLYANMENCHVDCTAMFFGYGGATDYVKIISGCVLNIKGVTISGRAAATPARNIVFENNIINSNATYYPVLSSFAKNITFRNNVMYLKGTRRCMDFTNADNITISNNRIKIGANYDVIQMNSPATNCQAKENIFEVEDGVTFTAQHYKGINKSTSTSNKIGDPFYEESTGKMLMYNGTAVVNLDGTPLT